MRASHHHVVSLDLRLLRRQFLALQFQTAAERREWWGVGGEAEGVRGRGDSLEFDVHHIPNKHRRRN